MSTAVELNGSPALPDDWDRLERVADAAIAEVVFWRRRAAEAEDEVARLRRTLEELASVRPEVDDDARQEIVRLRAENSALRSRMVQARQRIGTLLKRITSLELDT